MDSPACQPVSPSVRGVVFISVCLSLIHTDTHRYTHTNTDTHKPYPCQTQHVCSLPAVPIRGFFGRESGVGFGGWGCAARDFGLVESKAAHCYITSSTTALKYV